MGEIIVIAILYVSTAWLAFNAFKLLKMVRAEREGTLQAK